MNVQPSLDRLVVAAVPRDVLVVCGPEAATYLHGQISADVMSMEIGDSTLSFLLEPRGRVEAFFVISRVGSDTFVADTDAGFGAAMTAALERFKLRTKAEFSLQQWTMHAVRGPTSDPEPTVSAVATGPADAPEHVGRPTHWPLAGGHDLLACSASTVSSFGQGAEHVSACEFEALRMAYGLPAMGTEIQPGDIPNETGLVEQAASFTKGCYRGQELVERIDSRAGGRRGIRRFRAAGDIAAGEELRGADGAGIGTVLSAASLAGAVVGFASVRRDAAGEVSLDGGQSVVLADLF
ncbi:YgfZ/GcvT domain-containing protein [Candidatus Poriferisodalis sp.]|uniref:CAF17-like 4Fe-4S cluster assembly/insertion protein YgfZ n=1 Tax=Candidatus Poriferisodalis sp. TaxID=3101277 RepID=UPI003B0218D0